MQNILVTFVLFLIRHAKITKENKNRIISLLLDKIHAIPVENVVSVRTDGSILVKGRVLGIEQMAVFKDSAMALKQSFARKLIHEQMTREAIIMGVYKGADTDMMVFAKAWLYAMQEEEKLIDRIVGDTLLD